MEIASGNNLNAKTGVWGGTPEMRVDVAGSGNAGTSRAVGQTSNLTITRQDVNLAASEPITAIPEKGLSRDDDLGRLVAAAFSLQAPPMPSFV